MPSALSAVEGPLYFLCLSASCLPHIFYIDSLYLPPYTFYHVKNHSLIHKRDAMTAKDFIKAVANGEADIIQMLLDMIARAEMPYCIIGGLAVNAYADPVVSLDLDIVVVASHLESSAQKLARPGFR